jgi:hypothetical protein
MSSDSKKTKAAPSDPHLTTSKLTDPTNPKPGELAIDASALASFLIDLPPGGMQGMRTEQDGFDAVVAEILANQPIRGEAAGITSADVAVLATAGEQIALIDKYLGPAEKLVELLTETRAKLDDGRQRKVTTVANAVDLRAKDGSNDELLAAYEKTRAYRSAIGAKAAKTRQKNATAAEDKTAPAPAIDIKPA